MSNTETTTPTEDFTAVINTCIETLQTQPNGATTEAFRHNLRVAAFIYGTQDEVRSNSRNTRVIKNILTAIGYTEADTDAWFKAVEVQFGYETASSNQPVFAAA